MEAISRGVIEGVVQLVSRLVDPARPEESLEEDSWESLVVRLRADSSCPARAWVDNVRVGSHVLGVQPPVPAAGERHLRPDVVTTQLRPGGEPGCVLVEIIAHTLVVDVGGLGLCLLRTSSQHPEARRTPL